MVGTDAGGISGNRTMKAASSATLAILASGQFIKVELYEFTLADTSVVRLCNADAPITVGGNTYSSDIVIERGSFTQKIGLEVQSLDLTLSPQFDGSPPTFSGFPLLQAVNLGMLDNARVKMSKLFLSSWSDTSPGAVEWFQGTVGSNSAGRQSASLSIDNDLKRLNVSMPKNILQTGCIHTLYDAGCTLLDSAFRVSGTISGTPGVLQFNTNLTQVNKYFDLGRITFTSGANNGLKRAVKSYVSASGVVTLIKPLPTAPSAGDTFTIAPGCLKTQAACSNASAAVGPPFNNLAHFRGYPYVPVPETLYDGGASSNNTPAPSRARSEGTIAGSQISGNIKGGNTYVP
jgi:uncharacterized phage protein (TIGR02218 family)